MNGPDTPPLVPARTPRRSSSSGCFLKGCLTVVIVLMLLGVAIGGLGWYVSRHVQPFFSQGPVPIRTFQGGEPAAAAAQAKLAAFNQALTAGSQATLTLTADDLNALVAQRPEASGLRGHLFVSVENNQIVAETSCPLADRTGQDQHLYFNARFTLDASYASGDFALLLARLETLDRRTPRAFVTSAVSHYLNDAVQAFNRERREHPERNPALRAITDQLREIVIKDNQIVATSVEHPTAAVLPGAAPGASPVAETSGTR